MGRPEIGVEVGVGGERDMCWMGVGRWCHFFEGRIFCKTYSIPCELTVTL